MAEDWRLCLLKCKEELASDISFSMVAPSLIERAILSADEYSILRWILWKLSMDPGKVLGYSFFSLSFWMGLGFFFCFTSSNIEILDASHF